MSLEVMQTHRASVEMMDAAANLDRHCAELCNAIERRDFRSVRKYLAVITGEALQVQEFARNISAVVYKVEP